MSDVFGQLTRAPTLVEGIRFASFDSVAEDALLISRSAPSPEEKEAIEELAFVSGVVDFSMLLGDRPFKNREITYEFDVLEQPYETRKSLEQRYKRLLMVAKPQELYDTHDKGYHWFGKAKSVSIEDDTAARRLVMTVVMDVYPFMIDNLEEGNDIWNSFNFENDVSQYLNLQIDGARSVTIVNVSDHAILPEVYADGTDMIVTNNGDEVTVPNEGMSRSITLVTGVNHVYVAGTGTIRFSWHKEVMG